MLILPLTCLENLSLANNTLANGWITASCQTIMSPKPYIKVKCYKQQKWTFKNVRLTTFPKQQLHSISIFSMFVHPCLLLHYAVLFIPSFIVLCGYLCFAQFGGVLPLFEFWWISWYSSFNSLCLLYSKHPHIRTHDFRVQADLVLIYWVLSEKSVRCS